MKRLFLILFIGCLSPLSAFAGTTATTSSPIVINSVATTSKVVALTFDADMTPKMLRRLQQKKVASYYNAAVIDELNKEHVPATLFLAGMWIETYATTTRELSSNPLFEIANHSYSHGGFSGKCYGLSKIPESHDVTEVKKTDKLLTRYAVTYVKLFRFPGLCYDQDDVGAVTRAGYRSVGGDVPGDDGFQKDADKIVKQVVDKVKPGSIVVLHMHGGPNAPETAAALPQIIQKLREEGYTFVKVSELIAPPNQP